MKEIKYILDKVLKLMIILIIRNKMNMMKKNIIKIMNYKMKNMLLMKMKKKLKKIKHL